MRSAAGGTGSVASGGAELGTPHEDPREQLHRLLDDDPADLYENAPCGYLSTLPDGSIVKVNHTFCAWTGRTAESLLDSRLQDLLAPGGRIFTETHLMPLLRLQGAVREIALDVVRIDGSLLPCLLNAVEVRDDDGLPVLVRATLFDATARRRYERELLTAQRTAAESEARARTLHKVVSDLAAARAAASSGWRSRSRSSSSTVRAPWASSRESRSPAARRTASSSSSGMPSARATDSVGVLPGRSSSAPGSSTTSAAPAAPTASRLRVTTTAATSRTDVAAARSETTLCRVRARASDSAAVRCAVSSSRS